MKPIIKNKHLIPWEDVKKEMLKDWGVRFWYYLFKPWYWIESWKIRRRMKK